MLAPGRPLPRRRAVPCPGARTAGRGPSHRCHRLGFRTIARQDSVLYSGRRWTDVAALNTYLGFRASLGPRGGVVTQRSAKPCTPVQFRAWPPASSIDRQTAFGGPTTAAARSLPRISGATAPRASTAPASVIAGIRWRDPAALPIRHDGLRLNLCYAAKYCCHAARGRDSSGIPELYRADRLGNSPLAPETIFNDHACPFCPD
jgi:hypothetical protein